MYHFIFHDLPACAFNSCLRSFIHIFCLFPNQEFLPPLRPISDMVLLGMFTCLTHCTKFPLTVHFTYLTISDTALYYFVILKWSKFFHIQIQLPS